MSYLEKHTVVTYYAVFPLFQDYLCCRTHFLIPVLSVFRSPCPVNFVNVIFYIEEMNG